MPLRAAVARVSVLAALWACETDPARAPSQPPEEAPTGDTHERHASDEDAGAAPIVQPRADSALDGATGLRGTADAGVMDAGAGALEASVADTAVAAAEGGTLPTDDARAEDTDASAIHVEQLIDPQTMPISERGVYTDDGRFFVAGGSVLYEVVAEGQGFKAVELLREECVMGGAVDHGNLLYIGCEYDTDGRNPELLRVDPSTSGSPAVQRAELPGIAAPALVNGMEFGPDGALYFSNSGLILSGAPAVYRVEITSEAPLVITLSAFADEDAVGGAIAPNGIRFDGNMMYVSTGNTLVRMELRPDGTHGEYEDVFVLPLGIAVVDDFDIAEKQLFIARTDTADVLAVALLGSSSGSPSGSPLVVTTIDGQVEREVDVGCIPSGAAVRRDTLFGKASVIVTSYFNGGLYRITGLY